MSAIEHTWARIEVAGVPLDVSADAVRIDGVRVALSWTEADAMAQELGGELPTPAVLDSRYQAARYKTLPCPGPVTTRTAEQHSADIDRQLLAMGYDGESIVGNVGKVWCRADAPDEAPLYGWHVETHGKTWRGIPLYPCATGVPGLRVIQPHARRAHNREHRDYAMTAVFVRRMAAGPAPLWRRPDFTLGERCLAWLGDQYIREIHELPGAANDPRILAYSAHCRRGGRLLGVDAHGRPYWDGGAALVLDEDSDPWCAALASETLRQALLPAEVPPHGLRVSVRELAEDARLAGTLRPAGYLSLPGDLALLGRAGESPLAGGRGHVRRLLLVLDGGRYSAIGGNEADAIRVGEHALADVLAWVEYGRWGA